MRCYLMSNGCCLGTAATTTPQGQTADAQFVKWLMEHQEQAGVFATVSGLVDKLSHNPAVKMTAQEIAQRVAKAGGGG